MAAPNPGRRGNWENWDAKNDPSLHFGYDPEELGASLENGQNLTKLVASWTLWPYSLDFRYMQVKRTNILGGQLAISGATKQQNTGWRVSQMLILILVLTGDWFGTHPANFFAPQPLVCRPISLLDLDR